MVAPCASPIPSILPPLLFSLQPPIALFPFSLAVRVPVLIMVPCCL